MVKCTSHCLWEFCVCICFVMQEKDKAGCFASIVLQMYCYYKCSVAFLTVPWVGLQCVIVVFPDHTHLLFVSNNCR